MSEASRRLDATRSAGEQTASSSLAPADGTPWSLVLLICGAGVIAAFQVGKAAIALPALRSDLELSLATAGWVLSMFSVIGATVGSGIGAVIGRFSDRGAVLAGLGLVAAASLGGAFASGAAALLVSRFVEGFGFIVVVVAAPGLLARLARPADYKFVFALWSAYFPAGNAVMLLLGPWLLSFGWRGLWIANAAFALGFALPFARATRSLPAVSRARRGERSAGGLARDLRRTVSAPGPLRLALCFGCYTLQFASLAGFLPTIFVEREGFGPGAAGALTGAAVVANLFGNFVAGWILHRGVPRWLAISAGLGIMGVSAIGVFAAATPFWAAYLLILLLSVVGGIIPAAIVGGVPEHAPGPDLVPTTNGLVVQGSHIGQLAGPPLLGALAMAAGGWHLSPVVLTTTAAVGVAVALGLRRLKARA